jgi:hypothetical protein
MRKETNMMFIIVTCAILGIIACGVISILYSNGIFIDELIVNTVTIDDIMIIIVLSSIITGIILSILLKR